jgi:hypothetical protein
MKQWWEHFPTDDQPQQGGIVTKPADPTLPYKRTEAEYDAQAAPYAAAKVRTDAETAAATAPFDARKSAADAQKAELELEALRRKAADPTGALGVEQAKATGFYSRAVKANEAYEKLGVGAEPATVAVAKAILPGAAQGYVIPQKRQEADANTRGFISSVLRYESGAAIPPEEFESAYQTYFPQPGQGPDVVAAKARLRAEAIEALKMGSGPGAAQVQLPGQGQARRAGPPGLAVDVTDDGDYNLDGRPDATEPIITNLKNSGMNILAGLGQGLTALPDMAAQGMGQLMAMPVDWAGYDQAAEALRNPPQFGSAIERAVPTPQDWNGWGVRQAAKLEGGLLGFPAKAGNFLVDELVGKVPARPPTISNAPTRSQVMDDANALGIQPTAAAVGGPVSRAATATLAQTIGGARPIVAGAERMVDQGGKALSNIAGQEGRALNPEAMGQAATAGALKFRDASRDRIGQIYDKAAQIAGDVRVTPERTVAELDRNIAQLAEVPGGAEGAAYLKSLRDEIANNFPDGVTIQGFRGMRTALRDRFFKDGLRGSDLERRVNGVVDMVSEDLTQSLISQGKAGAASLFKKADGDWRQRAEMIDNTIIPIIGRKGEKSGEQVAKALQAAAQGNGARFSQFVKALPPEEAGNVRASLIEGLGRAKSGAQNAEGDAFSFASFLTNWTNISKTARGALFEEGDRQAIERLARVSNQVKEAAKYANSSNTGNVVVNAGTGAYAIADPLGGFLGVAATWGLGKALAAPGVARVVAGMATSRSPGQAKDAVKRLTDIAAKNPAVAKEVLGLRDQMARGLNDNSLTRFPAAAGSGSGGDERN